MEIRTTDDITQEEEIIDIPEIRVWCHPERIGEPGERYCEKFNGFKRALKFIEEHKKLTEAEPLIAFRGYEINLFKIKTEEEIEEREKRKKEKLEANEEVIEESKIEIKEKEVKEDEKSKN